MILRNLNTGDKFVHAKTKSSKPAEFEVIGSPTLTAIGSARVCSEIATGVLVMKKCSLEVKKTNPNQP